ncbi:hypothetical protein [Paenibacillus xerothermodurans]|uniref:MFS transporter n=1 Tax=Paenibacillus xerothermodurans TaxID=1977292 RepID=A0A2W1NHN3_PAEXE|nr:hypothetical protein [Paenibacillus xerothermodurans]PZE19045.1 hypothetical protein CBW46_020720 [Paenibacillus xerothermodurans]
MLRYFLALDVSEQRPGKLLDQVPISDEYRALMQKIGATMYPLQIRLSAIQRLLYDYTHADPKYRRYFLDEKPPGKTTSEKIGDVTLRSMWIRGKHDATDIFRGIQGLGAGAIDADCLYDSWGSLPTGIKREVHGPVQRCVLELQHYRASIGIMISEHLGWGWIYFLIIPIGIPAMFLMATAWKENMRYTRPLIDWAGVVTFSISIVSLLLGLVLIGNSSTTIALFSLSALFLVLFIWIETKAKEPMLPLQLFKIRVIAFGNIAGFFMSAGMFGAITFIPLFAQDVMGVSPTYAGYILIPHMGSVTR